MIDTNLASPLRYPGTLAFDAICSPTLRGVDIMEDGVLIAQDINGNTVTYTIPATSVEYPKRIWIQLSKIVGDGAGGVGNGTTGTNIPIASIVGLV